MMCIYKIENLKTNEIYVGSAINLAKRKYYHLYDLKNNKHHSIILQNSYNKHGVENFEFFILEEISEKENLIIREQYYIDSLNPKYNCSRVAGSPLGVKHSLEARLNMSKAHLGKKLSPESIAKRTLKQSGENHYGSGKERTNDVKKKISDGNKKAFENGRVHPNLGKNVSNDVKLKISETSMKPILQYSKTGEFIKEWKGAPIASKKLNINKSNINQACNGKLKTSGGFIWKFKE